jgi:hypothetical protein
VLQELYERTKRSGRQDGAETSAPKVGESLGGIPAVIGLRRGAANCPAKASANVASSYRPATLQVCIVYKFFMPFL